MGFFRKPTALENLRAAQENLERVKSTAPQERVQAIQAVGRKVGPGADWHPSLEHADQLIAEAELRVAEMAEEYARSEPQGVQLCSALDAALVTTRDALASVVDDPEPTLASTPEARAEYDTNCAKHAEACKANTASRLSVIGSAAASIAKAAVAAPKMLDAISGIVADSKSKLAAIADPDAPELGAPSAVTVQALSRALAAHRAHVEENEKKREAIQGDLIPVLRSINEGFVALGKKRREQGLPSPVLFRGQIYGQTPTLENLAWLAAGAGLTPELCDRYRACIGYPTNGAEGPKAVLRGIADRRKEWEAAQAKAERERERNRSAYFGRDEAGKEVRVPRASLNAEPRGSK